MAQGANQGRTSGRMAIGGLTAERLAPVALERPARAIALANDPRRRRPPLAGRADPGRDGRRGGALPRPLDGVPGARRRREPARPDGRYLEARGSRSGRSRPGPTGSTGYGCSTSSGCRARGCELARVARRQGVPVVLSPICWIEPRAHGGPGPEPASGGWRPGQVAAQAAVAPRLPAWRRELLRAGRRDPAQLGGRGASSSSAASAPTRARSSVVPNGVEARFARADPRPSARSTGPAISSSTSAGSSRGRTSSGLVEAVRPAGLPLVVIGDALPGHEGYAADCQRAGAGFVPWLRRVDHDDPLLASAYAAARVFALPSWFETPGLAALEAALAGTAVVDHAATAAPANTSATCVGYARPDRAERDRPAPSAEPGTTAPTPGLAAHVGEHYLWSDVARRTAEAYDQVAR